jgi:SAM-dependent methyltransferase
MVDYDTRFYRKQMDGSRRSARAIVPVVLELAPATRSVVDVGCGVGGFLKTFEEHAIADITGVDGSYVDTSMLHIREDRFLAADLTAPLRLARRFDLAMSLEVAEHLPESRGRSFIEDLARLSDIVLFSAAIPGQGGTHHVNEQWQDHWAEEFERLGYLAFDGIRPRIWADESVETWYAQNTLLYANPTGAERMTAGAVSSRAIFLPSLRVVHPNTWIATPGPARLWHTATSALPHYVRKATERVLALE